MIICDAFDGCEFHYDCRKADRCVYLEQMDQRAKAEDEAERHYAALARARGQEQEKP